MRSRSHAWHGSDDRTRRVVVGTARDEWSCNRVARTPRDESAPRWHQYPAAAPRRHNAGGAVRRGRRHAAGCIGRCRRDIRPGRPVPWRPCTQPPAAATSVLTSTAPDVVAADVARQLFASAPVVVVANPQPSGRPGDRREPSLAGPCAAAAHRGPGGHPARAPLPWTPGASAPRQAWAVRQAWPVRPAGQRGGEPTHTAAARHPRKPAAPR